MLRVNLTEAKSILTKTQLPGSDWVLNPYSGCTFACMYCYAAQIARWRHPGEEWGKFIDIKVNAPELLRSRLMRLEKKYHKKEFGSIFLSSVTDPYIGLETKYRLTRKCLEVLADFGYEGEVSIQTKSPLVTRDIDIIAKLRNAIVGFTVTTLDDKVSQFLEVNAPPVSYRLDAIRKLTYAGISTYAFVGPILPYFSDNEKVLSRILDELKDSGVSEVWFEHINLTPRVKGMLRKYLRTEVPELIEVFDTAEDEEYRDRLDSLIQKLMKKRRMRIGMGEVIYHRKLPKKK